MDNEDIENAFPERKTSLEVKLVDDKDSHTKENTNNNNNNNNNALTTGNDATNTTHTSNKLCRSFQDSRQRVSQFMQHNHKFHIFVTALVALDVAVIIVQLILEASRKANLQCPSATTPDTANNSLTNSTATTTTTTPTPTEPPPPKSTLIEDIEHVIHYISIGVLSIFMMEICLKLFAIGPVNFFKHKLEVMDAVVVSVAFFLDVFMSKEAVDDAVSLLVLVRLWRVLHIVSGIVHDVKMAAAKKEEKLRTVIKALEEELAQLKNGTSFDPIENGRDVS